MAVGGVSAGMGNLKAKGLAGWGLGKKRGSVLYLRTLGATYFVVFPA
jgi:hypothetical protein